MREKALLHEQLQPIARDRNSILEAVGLTYVVDDPSGGVGDANMYMPPTAFRASTRRMRMSSP